MRVSTRLPRSLDLAITPRSYVCSSCRLRTLHDPRPNSLPTQSVRYATGGSTPFTEKIRRKIWGTDNPPGAEDPYGGEGQLFKRQRAEQREREREVEEAAEAAEMADALEEEQANASPYGRSVIRTIVPEDFEPATNWEGLEHLGSLGLWHQKPPRDSDVYKRYGFDLSQDLRLLFSNESHSFESQEKITDPAAFRRAIHQAAVEIQLLHETGRDLNIACLETLDYGNSIDLPQQCGFVSDTDVSTAEGPLVTFPDDTAKETILAVFDQAVTDAEVLAQEKSAAKEARIQARISEQQGDTAESAFAEEETTPYEDEVIPSAADIAEGAAREAEMEAAAGEQLAQEEALQEAEMEAAQEAEVEAATTEEPTTDEAPTGTSTATTKTPPPYSLYTYPLENLPQKFAILKRVTQLTGHRIPDPHIRDLKSLGHLNAYLVAKTKPKPQKIAEKLLLQGQLAGMPNVKVMGRRQTVVDRETSVGRWKVIERELDARGLPVLGPRDGQWGQSKR